MKSRKLLLLIITPAIVLALAGAFIIFSFYGPHVKSFTPRSLVFIPDSSEYSAAMDSVEKNLIIGNTRVFKWLARKKHYPALVKPGKYVFSGSLSYIKLINILRSGRQATVKITFSNIRTLNEIAGRAGGKIEADSLQILEFITNPDNFKVDGFTKENVISVFIPDTYEFFWNTSANGFYSRMLREYHKFWNRDRLAKAGEKNLTPVEVSILASIIDDEVSKPDEKARIAGVYLNRLKRGIPLQACPTIKYALNDFTITRVLKKYLDVDSPYNTYRHKGFPPGPIGCPSAESIDAVLNAEKSDFLYFAAKADFSGYHNFSRTLAEHNRYAEQYQRELDKRKIYR